jgi:hypothetical protein
MRTICLLALGMTLAGHGTAQAQALGYAIGGPAGISGFFASSASLFHAAGGGEALVKGRAGIGAEFGALGSASSVLLVVSVNGVFHFPSSLPARLSPFVTGGYTYMGSGDGSFSGWNAGGGLDFWAKERLGLRVEFRDHVRPDFRGTVQYWTIRAGVVFK